MKFSLAFTGYDAEFLNGCAKRRLNQIVAGTPIKLGSSQGNIIQWPVNNSANKARPPKAKNAVQAAIPEPIMAEACSISKRLAVTVFVCK